MDRMGETAVNYKKGEARKESRLVETAVSFWQKTYSLIATGMEENEGREKKEEREGVEDGAI